MVSFVLHHYLVLGSYLGQQLLPCPPPPPVTLHWQIIETHCTAGWQWWVNLDIPALPPALNSFKKKFSKVTPFSSALLHYSNLFLVSLVAFNVSWALSIWLLPTHSQRPVWQNQGHICYMLPLFLPIWVNASKIVPFSGCHHYFHLLSPYK